MKINNFRRVLTNISAKKEALVLSQERSADELYWGIEYFACVVASKKSNEK